MELFPEHKDGANQAGDGHGPGDGVIVAQEYGVVAEHEQEIEGPEHEVPFHEDHYTAVVSHGAELNIVGYAAMFLHPLHEKTTSAGAKEVEYHEHHPQAKGGRHNEVLWS